MCEVMSKGKTVKNQEKKEVQWSVEKKWNVMNPIQR